MALIVILTKPPSHPKVVNLIKILDYNDRAEVYACGDGVYSFLNSNSISKKIQNIISKGGGVYASREDIEARGLTANFLIEGVKIETSFYDILVNELMKNTNTPIVV